MEPLRGGNSRRIAVAIATVVEAARGDVFAALRLRELPDFGEGNPALRGTRRMRGRIYWKRAAGRWRAGIIDRPVNNLASGSALSNVFGGHDSFCILFQDVVALNACAKY